MSALKKIAKVAANKLLPEDFFLSYGIYKKRHPEHGLLYSLFNMNPIYADKKLNIIDDYCRQFAIVCKRLDCYHYKNFYYPYEPAVIRICRKGIDPLTSLTVDFERILTSDINTLKADLEKCQNDIFANREISILDSIQTLAARIDKSKQTTTCCAILTSEPRSFFEALQKILFYNGLFWQMNHIHVGLGRLDLILYPYYQRDLSNNVITKEKAIDLFKDFLIVLGAHSNAKSLSIIGDTGQYVLVGGVDKDGTTVHNDLTEIIIDAFADLKIPDPKLLLRVNNDTNDIIWHKAIRCVMTGCGSPLIMNEKPIMDNMVKFGYRREDVWNVGTAACWEPLVIGKSFDQNNPFPSAVAMRPLDSIIKSGKAFGTFEELLREYKKGFANEIKHIVKDVDFDCSPLYSLFFDDCIARERDFSDGGAVYSYHGCQVVSLPNTINALLNIKSLVFEKKLLSLEQCRIALDANFDGYDDIRQLLLNSNQKYGSTDNVVLGLTNDLMEFAGDVVKKLSWKGCKLKIGFSSPSYVWSGKEVGATLDGRKAGEPFAVHISPVSSKIDIAEILDFASQLNYEDNRINGNVVDFILPSSYAKNQDKLIALLKDACNKGLFEIQLNVLDKATLIDAKVHPEKYPNLVVRVWGFSAYFNDLPEEFKDNLIQRAEMYETA